jgi:electron transport complex protein RnfC
MSIQPSFDEIIHKLNNDELWDFPGGIHPAERKELSNQQPIAKLPVAQTLFVTVKQHIGIEGSVIVEQGQQVLKGQALTKSANPFAVPVHAPTSGHIAAIEKHASPHPSGLPELTIKIDSDGKDTWLELDPMKDYQTHSRMDVLGKICDAGISGMGGAGFPSHIKLSAKKEVEFLIINGVECEPYITSDDRLMREHAWQIRQGIDVLSHLLTPKQVIIAIEHNKPEAIEAMQIACRENPLYKVVEIPTKYPSGGEKQLIQILTNREVPAQGLPIDVGIISHNVGTCFAIADAIFSGKPLIQRVVTITGEAINKPANYWLPIGTPIEHLLTHSDYQTNAQSQPRVIIGGPMMGFTAATPLVPVIKTSNCVLIPADKEMAELNEQACIRCGACADVCPAGLLPQQMFWHAKAKELDKVQEYNLFDCIECGACAYVCPSEIPLVHYYRIAKAEIRAEVDEKQQADKARERFEKRAARLKAEQDARDEKHRLAAEARKQAMSSKGNDAKDKIAAALARAKAKKQALTENNSSAVSDSTSPAKLSTTADSEVKTAAPTLSEDNSAPAKKSASSNQRVQAAIARAKAKKAAAQNQQNATENANPQTTSLKEDKSTSTTPVDTLIVETPTIDAKSDKPVEENTKQTKVAAAVEKAKAKRAAQKKAKTLEEKDEKTSLKSTDVAEKSVTQVTPTIDKVKEPTSTPEKTLNEDQLAIKKRRIATAVAKAKAKRQAEKALTTAASKTDKEDKPE